MSQMLEGGAPSSSVSPAEDFPVACTSLYPADFRYPVGYLAKPERVTDPTLLLAFEDWQRPYVVRFRDEVRVDPHVDVPVRRLLQGKPDTSIKSALRRFEWNGYTDESLQESFAQEDHTEEASDWSEAGMHGKAIEMIREMPEPFQKTAEALLALKNSLMALGRYEEALIEVRRLIKADAITEYARDLYRIDETEILLHLGRKAEAEAILDAGRTNFQGFWSYHAMRAVFAMKDGDEGLAKNLILKAGRVDNYHAYKMLWNRHLHPLADYIRRELVTADGKPLLYEQNSTMLRLCHHVHGAVLTEDHERGMRQSEGFLTHHVTDWSCAEAYVLALAGLGLFDWLEAVSHVLPGRGMSSIRLARAVAQLALHPDCFRSDEMEKLLSEVHLSTPAAAEFQRIVEWFRGSRDSTFLREGATIIADVTPKNWTREGRDHFLLLHDPVEGFKLLRFFQDRSVPPPMGWALGEHFPVLDENAFLNQTEVEAWLEQKLIENDGAKDSFLRCVWEVHLNGWEFPTHLKPNAETTPFVAEALRRIVNDPSLFFSNGPASSFGFHLSFGDKLVNMLCCWINNRSKSVTKVDGADETKPQ